MLDSGIGMRSSSSQDSFVAVRLVEVTAERQQESPPIHENSLIPLQNRTAFCLHYSVTSSVVSLQHRE